MCIGNYLKKTREEKGLSVRELSRLSGVSHPYISQIENGKNSNPSHDILQKLSQALDVPLYELMSMAGYIDNRTMVEEMILELNKIETVIRQTRMEIFDYEKRAESAEKYGITKKGHTSKEYMEEINKMLSYLDLKMKRRNILKEKIKENSLMTEREKSLALVAARFNRLTHNKEDTLINPEKGFPQPTTITRKINVPSEYKVNGKARKFTNTDILDLYYLIQMSKSSDDLLKLSFKGELLTDEDKEKILSMLKLMLE